MNTVAETNVSTSSAGLLASSRDLDRKSHELSVWVRAIGSFFDPRNHPQPEASYSDIINHDWSQELRIVCGLLQRSAQLASQLATLDGTDNTIFDDDGDAGLAGDDMVARFDATDNPLPSAAIALADAYALCKSVMASPPISLHVWTKLGGSLADATSSLERSKAFARFKIGYASGRIPEGILALVEGAEPPELSSDVRSIVSDIFDLLGALGYVETLLRHDQSLKQTLPAFTLVKQEAQRLAAFIKDRTLRIPGLPPSVFETLDSTHYAITMELRKVFAHELVGFSALRQPPALFIKVETAHGLLANCFRQSVISIAQLFDPELEGSQLFDAFQTRLEQSLALRRDLWVLLQLVRRAEEEPEGDRPRRLIETLSSFYEGSLRYLMFKDWESCEHFMEEVGAARGPGELRPIVHRFAAYLEALSNQVNMRAVLANHPFDYPVLDED